MDTTDDQLAEDERTPFMRRRSVRATGIVGLVGAAIAGTYLATRSSDRTTEATVQRSTTLVRVERRDLIQTASFDGTVDYARARTITAASLGASQGSSAGASASGVVTSVATVGSVVRQGGVLFTVNAQPTVLMYGSYPAYRELSSAAEDGPDILQLQTNLLALGHYSSWREPSETWSSSTRSAVIHWQEALGIAEDGRVPLGRVVFAPGPVRIASAASVGEAVTSSSSVMTISSTRRQATVALTASDAAIVGVGNAVTVTLPSGATTPGKVTKVATVATSTATSATASGGAVNQQASSSSSASIEVTISLASAAGLGSLATAPVSVAFTQQRARNVLAVPTTALLTLADGGFAVEISSGGSTKLVRVTPGLFAAGGFVGLKGAVKEGDRVVVPQ